MLGQGQTEVKTPELRDMRLTPLCPSVRRGKELRSLHKANLTELQLRFCPP